VQGHFRPSASSACGDSRYPLDAEVAQFLRVARIVVGCEMPEMVTENVLQGVGALLGIGRPLDGWWPRGHTRGKAAGGSRQRVYTLSPQLQEPSGEDHEAVWGNVP